MRFAGPSPSLSCLFSSWWALTGWILSAFYRRATALAENCNEDALVDSITDLGCPKSAGRVARGEVPALDAEVFSLDLLDDAQDTLRRVALALDDDPHGCLEEATRERVRLLFEELAERAVEHAQRTRIAATVGGEIVPGWAARYRRMMAEEGVWPTTEESSVSEEAEHAVS